jgi:hypothetical protein
MMRKARTVIEVLIVLSALGFARSALADDTIKHPGDHPHYAVELEPHGLVGWAAQWAGWGFGVGGRVSINLTHDGFIPSINNSVAISLGLDWVHYAANGGCFYMNGICNYGPGYYTTADFFQFPVAMQWNFYVAKRWSVFGEPGLYIWHGSYSAPSYACNGPGQTVCYVSYGSDTGVGPAFWVGGRFHFSDSASLTMRLGYPDFLTVGVSFFP